MRIYSALLSVFMLLLSGCSLLNKPPEQSTIIIGESGAFTLLSDGSTGVTTCSETCEKKSQCGVADGSTVIMGKSIEQAVDPMQMDLLWTNETAVSILSSRQRTVQKTNGEQENVFFYNITTNDGSGRTGWVAGWCIAAAIQPAAE